jgi:hypothetical protein
MNNISDNFKFCHYIYLMDIRSTHIVSARSSSVNWVWHLGRQSMSLMCLWLGIVKVRVSLFWSKLARHTVSTEWDCHKHHHMTNWSFCLTNMQSSKGMPMVAQFYIIPSALVSLLTLNAQETKSNQVVCRVYTQRENSKQSTFIHNP